MPKYIFNDTPFSEEELMAVAEDAGITLEQLWSKMTQEQRLKYGQ